MVFLTHNQTYDRPFLPIDGRVPQGGEYSIAIIRALPGLGDFLCVVPALRALRAAFPEAYIALIGLENTRHLAARFTYYIDALLPFPGFPGLKEQPVNVSDLLLFLAAHQGRFDLALQMHGSGVISNIFTMLLDAELSAGYYVPGHYCPDELTFIPYSGYESEVLVCLRLIESLGISLEGNRLEFPLYAKDYDAYEAVDELRPLEPDSYICIHPGASRTEKRWPAACFAAVADALAARGFQIVLTGTAEEVSITRATAEAMTYPALDMAGRTSIGALAVLLHNAALLVCNDTGVSHLAAALQLPSVTIFINSDPSRWAPLDRERHRVVGLSNSQEIGREAQNDCAGGQLPLNGSTSSNINSPVSPAVTGMVSAVLVEIESLLHEEILYAA